MYWNSVPLKEGQGRERDGKGRRDLGQPSAAQFPRHQAGNDDGRSLGENREKPQPNQRKAEEFQADALDERA